MAKQEALHFLHQRETKTTQRGLSFQETADSDLSTEVTVTIKGTETPRPAGREEQSTSQLLPQPPSLGDAILLGKGEQKAPWPHHPTGQEPLPRGALRQQQQTQKPRGPHTKTPSASQVPASPLQALWELGAVPSVSCSSAAMTAGATIPGIIHTHHGTWGPYLHSSGLGWWLLVYKTQHNQHLKWKT